MMWEPDKFSVYQKSTGQNKIQNAHKKFQEIFYKAGDKAQFFASFTNRVSFHLVNDIYGGVFSAWGVAGRRAANTIDIGMGIARRS